MHPSKFNVPREAETMKFLVASDGVAIAVTQFLWPFKVAVKLSLKLEEAESIFTKED